MTSIDWVIVAFIVLLALYGYMQGFIVGALSLAGFAIGAFLGTRLAPLVLPGGSHSQYAPLFGLLGALLAGGVLASGFEGLAVRARSLLRLPGLRTVDGMLGAVLTACVGLGIAWIIGAIAVQSSGSDNLRADIQRSAILRGLNQLLPPSGPILNALSRFDPLPSVRGPAADVPPPRRGILATRGVITARSSVVRVVGTACGLGHRGQRLGRRAPGLVVTNAHVVAGESDTVVQIGGVAPGLPAHVFAFDPHDDVAVLRVSGLRLRPLKMAADPRSGTAAAVLGYPLDGPFDAEPARHRPDPGGQHRGRLRQRSGAAQHHLAARQGAPGQLRRADGRRRRARGRDRVRRDHRIPGVKGAWRVRRAQRAGAQSAGGWPGAHEPGEHPGLHELGRPRPGGRGWPGPCMPRQVARQPGSPCPAPLCACRHERA